MPSPTVDPNRVFTDKQNLSLANQTATVSQGSSLFSIAQSNSISVTALAKLNSIDNPDTVKAGQTVVLPDDLTTDTYTVLFVTNPQRLDKEKKTVSTGGTSLYTDPITAAQTDVKGIYKLAADTPYSKSQESDTAVTLTTSDADKLVTVTMAKDASGLWLVKKLAIKITKTSSATPTP
jgi:LysM repeat protein